MSSSLLYILVSIILFQLSYSYNPGNPANTCEYHCEDKKQTPWMKIDHVFTSNGCGSMGIQISLDKRIEPCCDTHDACYSSLVYFYPSNTSSS